MDYGTKTGAHLVFTKPGPDVEHLRIDSVGSCFAEGKEISRSAAEDILRKHFEGEQLNEMVRALHKHARPAH